MKLSTKQLKQKVSTMELTKEDLYQKLDVGLVLREIANINWEYVAEIKQSSKCPYCRIHPKNTKDHLISALYRRACKKQGIKIPNIAKVPGLTTLGSCKTCNNKKQELLPSEWLEEIEAKFKKAGVKLHPYYCNVKDTLEKILNWPQ